MTGLSEVTQPSRIVTLRSGATVEVRPLTLNDFATIQEEALAFFIRQRAAGLRAAGIEDREEFLKIAEMTGDQLPRKIVQLPDGDNAIEKSVPYEVWWMTQQVGAVRAVWLSLRRAKPMTFDECNELFRGENLSSLPDVVQAVQQLSSPNAYAALA